MERRDALKYTAFFMGASLSAATISSIVSGCYFDQSDNWKPTFFTPDQAKFIREIGETMLPKTNTPGAKDAKVDRYLDTIRPLRFETADNEKYKLDLDNFIAETTKELGKPFIKLKKDKAAEWLTEKDKQSFSDFYAAKHLDQNTPRPFYLTLKEQILGAYFASEIVAKEYFNFDPIPTRYDPCIPLTDVQGKAWAL